MKTIWMEKDEYFPRVIQHLEPVESVLDIGCGIVPQKYIRPLVHICCEPFEQYVEVLKEKIINEYDRHYLILQASWSDTVQIFPSKSVDSVFLIDVIEHIEKNEALRLLRATENIARRQVAIFTPLGFFPQKHKDEKDAWGLSGANWQEHKSGWQPEDFDDSWRIYACGNFHATNNLGEPLETPTGAFWAIKTFEKTDLDDSGASKKRRDIYRVVSLVLDINRRYVSQSIIFFMGVILRLKKTRAAEYFYHKFIER